MVLYIDKAESFVVRTSQRDGTSLTSPNWTKLVSICSRRSMGEPGSRDEETYSMTGRETIVLAATTNRDLDALQAQRPKFFPQADEAHLTVVTALWWKKKKRERKRVFLGCTSQAK